MKHLQRSVDAEEDITNKVELLYYSSHLDSGFSVDNPNELTTRIYKMMSVMDTKKEGNDEPTQTNEIPEVVKPEKVENIVNEENVTQEVNEINV